MIGLDTNILVRYLTQDDEVQCRTVNRLFGRFNSESPAFVNNIVFCEMIWVLESNYKYSKKDIIMRVKFLLATEEIVFEDLPSLLNAIDYFEKGIADFSDCLIGIINKKSGCEFSFTFDKDAGKNDNFKLLI